MRLTAVGTGLAVVIATLAVTAATVVTAASPAAADVGGDPSAEAVALAEAAQTGKRVEVKEDDTETVTVYANPDGTLTSEVSQAPIRVRDDNGNLVPIDLGLEASDGRLAPAASSADVSFSSTGNGVLAELGTAGDTSFGMKPPSDLNAPTVTSAGTATYAVAGSDPSTVQVDATSSGFSAHVVLPSVPDAAPTYDFPLQLNGLHAALAHGQLVLSDDAGKTVAISAPLQMWDAHTDAAGDPDHVATVDASLVVGDDGGTILRLQPAMSFLTDPDTQYPVTVDPDVNSVSRDSDTQVNEGSKDTNYGGVYRLRVGSSDGTNAFRTLERFDVDAFMGTNIESATLKMYQYYGATCSSITTNVYPTTSDVDSGVTWNQQPTVDTSDRWRATLTGNSGFSASCPAGQTSMDVTAITNGYTTGTLNSDVAGSSDPEKSSHVATYELQGFNEHATTSDKRFCSMNYSPGTAPCTVQANVPTLSLTYSPDLGDKSFYSTTDHQLNERTTLKINNQDGNALVKADDIKIKSLGQPLNISRYYNSESDATGAFGPKWSLSVGPDVQLQKKTDTRYSYLAASGAVYAGFTRRSSDSSSPDYTKFDTPQGGVDSSLVDNGGGDFTLTNHKSQMKYEFDNIDSTTPAISYLTKTTDRSGNAISYAYTSGTHRLSSVTDASGQTLSFSYTSGVITAITDSNGPSTRTWGYGYNSLGQLTSYTDPAGKTVNYGWSTATATSPDPQVVTIADAANQSGSRPTTTLTYYKSTQVTAVRYTTGSTSVGYDFTLSTTTTLAPACKSTDDTSMLVDDTIGKHVTYCFQRRDDQGDQTTTRTIDGNGNSASTSYSLDNQPTTSINGKGASTVAAYGGTAGNNAPENLTSVTDPSDSSGSTPTSGNLKYNVAAGTTGSNYLPSAKIDGNGVCTDYQYDTTGRLTDSYIDPANGCSSPAAGSHYHQELNSDGTVNWSTNPQGTYSLSGNEYTDYDYWATTDTGYVAGTKGLLKTMRRPGGSCSAPRSLCTSFVSDGLGRVVSMTDGRSKVTRYTYDKLDRLTQVLTDGATTCTQSAGTCITYSYDAEGNLTQRVDAQGTTTYTYDQLNRQRSVTTPDGAVVSYTYDDDGKLLELDTTVSGGATQVTTYTYDNGEQPASVTNPVGTINIQHDANNKENYTKFPTSPYVTINRDFSNSGRPKSIVVQQSGNSPGDLPTWTYSYQKPGADTTQVQKITVTGSTSAINQAVSYTYNAYGALTQANADTGSNYTYTYDGATNVKSEQIGSTTTYYGYDEAGQVCWQGTTTGTQLGVNCPATPTGDTAISRDAAGNDLGTAATPLAYNGYNQVASIDGRAQKYNDQGNDLRVATAPSTTLVNSNLGVIARTTSTGTTYYTRDPSGKILAEYGASGTYYYVTNAQGSVTTLINTTGGHAAYYRYSPYGATTIVEDNTANAGANNPWRYIGGYYDLEGDGYTKLGARYTDNHSHFNQPDPKPGNLNDPLTTLTYDYASGDPLNSQDPTGRDTSADVIGGAFALAGFVAGAIAIAPVAPVVALTAGAVGAGIAAGGLAFAGGVIADDLTSDE